MQDGVFQHTATRRWLLPTTKLNKFVVLGFNTQPPEGGCSKITLFSFLKSLFQHTATRRWLPLILLGFSPQISVSTHSHPKVAAISFHYKISFCCCFNTQPPEGGCKAKVSYNTARRWFQHTATRRWLPLVGSVRDFMSFVSTHSHPKVAALYPIRPWWTYLSFNTQPPEGGCVIVV